MLWLLFLACTTERPSDRSRVYDTAPDVECDEGFYEGDDGNCYEIRGDDDPVDIAFAALPECHLLDPDDRLDLFSPCVDGACAGDTFQAAEDALGPAYLCDFFDDGWVDCRWDTVAVRVITPGDELPDPDGRMYRVEAMRGYEGADEDGLGIGISLACWLEVLGDPDAVEFTEHASEWGIYDVWWDAGLMLFDYVDESGSEGTDGLVDWAYLYAD